MARPQRFDTARVLTVCLLVGAAFALACPVGASAQAEDEAEALFREGVALREAGDTSGAIERLRAAQRLRPDDRSAYNLAAALVDAGRLVEARTLLRRIVARPTQLLIADAASTLLNEVSPRIATVSVTIEGESAETRLMVDGDPTEAGLGASRAVALDPGMHRFELRDPRGSVLARSEVDVGEGERRTVVLRPVVSARAAARAATDPTSPPPVVTEGSSGDDTWLWVGVGVGAAVAIGVAIVIVAVLLGGQGSPAVTGDLPEVIVRGRE